MIQLYTPDGGSAFHIPYHALPKNRTCPIGGCGEHRTAEENILHFRSQGSKDHEWTGRRARQRENLRIVVLARAWAWALVSLLWRRKHYDIETKQWEEQY